MITRTVFERVTRAGVKKVPCSRCGKAIRRQKTFSMTLNPWNVNERGEPRTRSEIYVALGNKIADWQALSESHNACEATS